MLDIDQGEKLLKIKSDSQTVTTIYQISDYDDPHPCNAEYHTLVSQIEQIDTDTLIEAVGEAGPYQKQIVYLACV